MEQQIITAIKTVLPNVEVYNDFAGTDPTSPYVVIQRVGGEGQLYLDKLTKGGYQVRLQVAVWAADRITANNSALLIESAITELPQATALGAAVADFDEDTNLRGMRQDFSILI